MSKNESQHVENEEISPRYETDEHAEKRFRGWHLLGLVLGIVALVALAAFIVDWVVIGPLRGRVY
ncbi:MAG: hypothetical protein PVH91_08540 [Pseudomonadales bacterium]|jgi:hypothetical protein